MTKVAVKVSGKWARRLWVCNLDYITHQCHGRCCEGQGTILVALTPGEEAWHKANTHTTNNGLLCPSPTTSLCPHKQANGLCGLHNTPNKPFGCMASPFTLNRNDTLVCRQRYARLRCHGAPGGKPVYITFRPSLDLIFGTTEAECLCRQIANGDNNILAFMPEENYRKFKYLSQVRRGGKV